MKNIILASIICTTTLVAEDLGFIGPNKAIWLDAKSTNLNYFVIELLPAGQSNVVTIIKTNNLLTTKDLENIPSGYVVMGVKSIHSDVLESPIGVYTFILNKDILQPTAHVVNIPYVEGSDNLTNALRRIKESQIVPHPPVIKQSVTYNPQFNTFTTNTFKPLPSADDAYWNKRERPIK